MKYNDKKYDTIRNMTISLMTINDDINAVEAFVSQKYANGWVMNAEIVSDGVMSRLFTDDYGVCYTIKYCRNKNRAWVPTDIASIEFNVNMHAPSKKLF